MLGIPGSGYIAHSIARLAGQPRGRRIYYRKWVIMKRSPLERCRECVKEISQQVF